MNRSTVFGTAVIAGIGCLIVMILYWTGSAGLGHHPDGPYGIKNLKHGILFLGLAVIAFLFAAVNRPLGADVATSSEETGSGSTTT